MFVPMKIAWTKAIQILELHNKLPKLEFMNALGVVYTKH
jgi:hypothetical protein